MHIFNLNNKPNLILTNTELLFRDTPTDEKMNRHAYDEIEKISLEHRYDTDKELFIWLKVKMKTVKAPHLIQLSCLDTPLEELILTLENELTNKVPLSLPKMAWLNEVKTQHKKRKQLFAGIALILVSLFLFHKFYTPRLDTLVKNALEKQFTKNIGLCSVQAKAAYPHSTHNLITLKSYCGVFGLWHEVESKEIPSKQLTTEFSSLKVHDYTKIIQEAINKKDYITARKNVAKVLYLEPKNANAHLLLGVIDYESGHKEEAFISMQKAVSLDKTSVSILNRVAFYYSKDSRYEKSYTYATQALSLSNSATELINVAILETKLGKTDKAVKHFEKSLYEESNNTMVYNQLGMLYWKTTAYKKAGEVFKKAYELQPKSSNNFVNYYEISLIEPTSLSTQEIQDFETTFSQNKDVFITYEMLRILKLSINSEDIMPSLQKWDSTYSGIKLNWSFKEMLSWVDNNHMSEDEKHNIKKTIGFFIAYQQIYNLEHPQESK